MDNQPKTEPKTYKKDAFKPLDMTALAKPILEFYHVV